MIVDFLLVAWITLARMELRDGAILQAAALVQQARTMLDTTSLQALYPDRDDDPNDTRHRLRTRLLEAQALVAWAQGRPTIAREALSAALPLITFAVGVETVEGRHIAAQLARVESGAGPLV
jgi:hypothetical protein